MLSARISCRLNNVLIKNIKTISFQDEKRWRWSDQQEDQTSFERDSIEPFYGSVLSDLGSHENWRFCVSKESDFSRHKVNFRARLGVRGLHFFVNNQSIYNWFQLNFFFQFQICLRNIVCVAWISLIKLELMINLIEKLTYFKVNFNQMHQRSDLKVSWGVKTSSCKNCIYFPSGAPKITPTTPFRSSLPWQTLMLTKQRSNLQVCAVSHILNGSLK